MTGGLGAVRDHPATDDPPSAATDGPADASPLRQARPGTSGSVRGGEIRREPPPRPTLGSRFASAVGRRIRARLIVLASWLACRLPEKLAIRIADVAGIAWYRLTPERAALARRQLRRVAEALAARGVGSDRARAAATNPRALERLVRLAYRHAARYYVEVMRTPELSGRYIAERVLIETPDAIDAAFDGNRPVIFVGLHFGAIELPALYAAERSGRTVTGPMETVGDPELQAWFVRTRGRVGVRIVGLREARRELLAALRDGGPVGLVADRDITGGGVEVSLFGHPARLPVGPALLGIESGAGIYVAAVRRDGPGRYRAQVRAVEVPPDGPRRDRAMETTRRLAAVFEDVIAQAPEQWWAVFFPIWADLATGSRPSTSDPAAPGDGGA